MTRVHLSRAFCSSFFFMTLELNHLVVDNQLSQVFSLTAIDLKFEIKSNQSMLDQL